jgi:hypothetical protein
MAFVIWGDSLTTQMLTDATAIVPFQAVAQNFFVGYSTASDTPVIKAFKATIPQLDPWVHMFWGGQHIDVDVATTLQAEVDMVNTVTHGKFIVISGINDGNAAAGRGPSGATYLKLVDFNAQLRVLYPSNYLDLREQLVAYGVSIADANSVSYDAPPSTYQPTDVHFNTTGRTFCANAIVTKMRSMGYLDRSFLKYQAALCGGN